MAFTMEVPKERYQRNVTLSLLKKRPRIGRCTGVNGCSGLATGWPTCSGGCAKRPSLEQCHERNPATGARRTAQRNKARARSSYRFAEEVCVRTTAWLRLAARAAAFQAEVFETKRG